jgi:Fic family protein
MRRIARYIHELPKWPHFQWDHDELGSLLASVRHRQGRLLGRMESLGFDLRSEATLQTLTLDVVKSSEIEGEVLDRDQVRSSIAKRLGMDVAGLVPTDRHVEGIVEMMLDATQNNKKDLSARRLYDWHAAMFPTARSGMQKIVVGKWRNNTDDDPMQVVSGPIGKERVHFEAPASALLKEEMRVFIDWFNDKDVAEPVLKAAIAHLWFVTVHPFDDGNGRIARAIADMQLARSDDSSQRFYSMSAQIRKERTAYYDILEKTQKGTLDITDWLNWFLQCLDRALTATEATLSTVLIRANFWKTHEATEFNQRQKQMLSKLMEGFEGKLTTSKWAKITKCSHDTALRDIQDLVEKNVLMKDEAGGRSTGYTLKSTH